MELLNLDELETITKTVKLGGKEYPIKDQTVGQMVSALQRAKTVEQAEKDENVEVVLQELIETARRLIPSAPAELVEGLSMKQLAALIEFASASQEAVVEASDVEVVDKEKGVAEKQ